MPLPDLKSPNIKPEHIKRKCYLLDGRVVMGTVRSMWFQVYRTPGFHQSGKTSQQLNDYIRSFGLQVEPAKSLQGGQCLAVFADSDVL